MTEGEKFYIASLFYIGLMCWFWAIWTKYGWQLFWTGLLLITLSVMSYRKD